MSDNMKGCPFCGSNNVALQQSHARNTWVVYGKCLQCGASAKAYACHDLPSANDWDTDECHYAISSWNSRAVDYYELINKFLEEKGKI